MNPNEAEEALQNTTLAGAVGQQAQSSAAAQYFLDEKQKGLAETQLEVDSIIIKCYHLLKQEVIIPDEEEGGTLKPKVLSDEKQRILTEEGVERIMQIIHFYVNKNTLLSNFDEKQINRIMLRFLTELNDLFLLKYQILFCQPTFEECKEIFGERIREQVNLKVFAADLIDKKVNEVEIEKEIFKKAEERIEYEIKKIKNEQIKEKLREYGLIVAQLEMIVYACLNRAWKGEERGSIRRHTNISEIIGNRPTPQKESGGMFKWARG